MKYKERSVTEWIENGYNPIHIIGDYYLLRKYSLIYKDFSTYHLAKIHDTIPPIKQCLCGGGAKLIKVGDQKQYYVVQCSKCYGNMAESCEAKVNPAEAVRLWNRRIIAMSPMRKEERAVE